MVERAENSAAVEALTVMDLEAMVATLAAGAAGPAVVREARATAASVVVAAAASEEQAVLAEGQEGPRQATIVEVQAHSAASAAMFP